MLINLEKLKYTGNGHSSLKKSIFYSTPENCIIIDTGCNRGWWMQAMNAFIPDEIRGTVVKIGIDPINYPDRQANGDYSYYFEEAIGLEDREEVSFYIVGTEPGCNSLLKPSEHLQNTTYQNQKRIVSEIIKVKQSRLDTILDNIEDKLDIYYAKFDLQGADLDGIKSLGKYLKKVEYLELELSLDENMPFYENSSNMQEILDTLNNFGFEVIEFSSFPSSPLPEGELLLRRKND